MDPVRAEKTPAAPPKKAAARAPGAKPRKERLLPKIARLAAFLCVVSAALAVVAASRAIADVEDAALSLGNELGKLGEAGQTRSIRLNGQSVHVVASTEDGELGAHLDRFESYCRASTAGLDEGFQALPAEVQARIPKGGGRRAAAGVLREETAAQGMVACVVRPEGEAEGGVLDLVDRVSELGASGDLSALGHMRYFHARATKKGRTHIVAAWTDGPFRLDAMFPDAGDAPGQDPRFAPRPPRSVRLLTAEVDGVPYGVRLYDAEGPPERVFAEYDRDVLGRGFSVLAQNPEHPTSRVYHRGESDLLVTVDGDDRGRSLVSLIETSNLRNTPRPPSTDVEGGAALP